MLIAEAVQGFYRRCKAEGVSANTIKTYSYHFYRFIHHLFADGKEKIEDVKTDDIRKYLIGMQDAGYSPHTVADVYRSISCFFSWLYTENMIVENPMQRVKKPKVPKEFARTFSHGEVRMMFDFWDKGTFYGYRNFFIINLLLGTGIRKSELLQLSLTDIDFDARVLLIRGKGDKQRFVPLSKMMVRLLRNYLLKRKNYLADVNQDSNALFVNRLGRRLGQSGLEEIFAKMKKGLKIDKRRLSPHTFRHTFSRAFLSNGGNLFSLQDILGHEDIATTRIYVDFGINGNRQQIDSYCPIDNLAWQYDD